MELDPIRTYLTRLVAERGVDLKAVSLAIGRNHAYLQQYLARKTPRTLPEDAREALGRYFGVEPSAFKPMANGSAVPTPDVKTLEPYEFPPGKQEPPLPILGHGMGGRDAMFLDQGQPQGVTPRPANLAGVKQAFAIYMTGSSMEPRYVAGELLYIHPFKPVRAKHYVLVEMQDHSAYVKRFVRRDDKTLVVEQLNPKKTITLKVSDVLHVYRVVGAIED